MEIVIDAVYEQGRLRPLSPLVLPENARVRITVKAVEPLPDNPQEQRLWVERLLVEAGLSVPSQPAENVAGLLTERERTALAKKVGVAQPISDLIIEERRTGP